MQLLIHSHVFGLMFKSKKSQLLSKRILVDHISQQLYSTTLVVNPTSLWRNNHPLFSVGDLRTLHQLAIDSWLFRILIASSTRSMDHNWRKHTCRPRSWAFMWLSKKGKVKPPLGDTSKVQHSRGRNSAIGDYRSKNRTSTETCPSSTKGIQRHETSHGKNVQRTCQA